MRLMTHSPAHARKTVNEQQRLARPKQKLPLMSHRDHAREILTEPTSTKWKPSLHETRVYCLDSADSAQCSHSDSVTATRRERGPEGGRETGEDRIGRKGGMEGKRRGTFPPLTGIYSSAVLFTSPVVLLWRSGGGTNYWAMFLFFEVLLL